VTLVAGGAYVSDMLAKCQNQKAAKALVLKP